MGNVNINEIARIAGVSRTTVSRVLNNSAQVKPETAGRIKEVIDQLGYQPSELARGLRINETKTVGVIVSNVLNPFFTAVVRGVEDVASQSNYNIILCNTDEDHGKESQYIRTLTSKHVDGLIIASTGGRQDYRAMTMGKPIVFIDRKPLGCDGQYDTVLVNNREGSRSAVEYMLSEGYRRIGIVSGPIDSLTGRERLEGYEQALREKGVEIDNKIIKIGDFLGHASFEHTLELLDSGCDAIYSANNIILHGVMKAMNWRGVRYPEDMGLLSFDDLEWMEYCPVPITAVNQPTYEIGALAMRRLLQWISGSVQEPDEFVLEVSLKIRESSKRKKL